MSRRNAPGSGEGQAATPERCPFEKSGREHVAPV
jgi:hypothetical protein